MNVIVEMLFRFVMYVFLGFTMETIFSVTGINKVAGIKVERRVPKKYLEGFISLYMIPVYGFGFFAFRELFGLIQDWFILWRYLIWCVLITGTEAIFGFAYDKILGFYPWDYYAGSKYKVFKRGYTLWTLAPLWGLAGLLIELYIKIVEFAAPHILDIVMNNL